MAEDNSVFRISVRGYNRSDVNDYIFSENRRFKAIEDEYKSTIEELKRRLDEANARADELAVKEKDDTLNLQKINELEAETARLRSELESEREKNAALTNNADALTTELLSAKREVESLTAALEAAASKKSEEVTEAPAAAHENDDTIDPEAIAEMLKRTHSASLEMIGIAEKRSAEMLERAREEAAQSRAEMLDAAKKMLDRVQSDVRESVDTYMGELLSGIDTAKKSSFAVAEEFEKCGTKLSRRLSGMQNDLDRAIAEKLAELEMTPGDEE